MSSPETERAFRNPRTEILAPVGTEESLGAALSSGADAIYLGLSEGFNARRRSTAFTLEMLPGLVRRAHFAGTKLYLTINTLVFESELEQLEALLRRVIEASVDALIIQDPATAFIARRLAPRLRLHASTQMTISSAEGAEFARTLGMSRVVLPRELSVAEISRFTSESSLEAEVFVHGALCMAWSGQCLTSEAFSDRSANRGQCSQACRMPYEAVVDGEKRPLGDQRYLLSPQDLAAHDVVPELMNAGVVSLKIEGRYKGASYVASAVDSYRNWRDANLRGVTESDRKQLAVDRKRAQLTYTRGASLGFLGGENHQQLVVGTTPKHRGIELGTVRSVRAKSVFVELTKAGHDEALRPGMGVKFELVGRRDDEHDPEHAPGGPIFEIRARTARELELVFGRPGPDLSRVRPGDLVRWTGDPGVAREAEKRALQPIEGRLPVSLAASGEAGVPLVVRAVAGTPRGDVSVSVEGTTRLSPALSGNGLDEKLLEHKLGALGGTPFHLVELDCRDLKRGLHLPVSELKALRRSLVAQLESEMSRPRYPISSAAPCISALRSELGEGVLQEEGAPQLVPLFRTEEQLRAFIDSAPEAGTEVELDWMEMVGLSRAVAQAKTAGLRVTLATVRVQKPGEEAFDRRIFGLKPDGVLVRHWGALMHFSKKRDAATAPDFSVHGDFSLNVTNSLTARHLLGLGLASVTASHDLNKPQLLELLANVPRGRVAVVLHHHIPTFHNSHCVYAHLLSEGKDYRDCGRPCEKHRIALRDYAGHEHPMVVDVSCRNTMFNATAQSAAPLVPRLLELGVRRFRVEFVWERGEEVTRTLSAYRRLMAGEIEPKKALEIASVPERYGVTTLRVNKG